MITEQRRVSIGVPRIVAFMGVLALLPVVAVTWRFDPWAGGGVLLYAPGLLLGAVVGVERLMHR